MHILYTSSVCIYIYIYVYIYIYICMNICTHLYKCMHIYTHWWVVLPVMRVMGMHFWPVHVCMGVGCCILFFVRC